jgi:hypothetical protein
MRTPPLNSELFPIHALGITAEYYLTVSAELAFMVADRAFQESLARKAENTLKMTAGILETNDYIPYFKILKNAIQDLKKDADKFHLFLPGTPHDYESALAFCDKFSS